MRLIDADTLKAEFTGNFNETWHYTGVRAMIDVAPTVDAVPVVRCINCQHCDNDIIVQKLKNGTERRINICLKHESTVADDYFCADGERKKSDEQID